MRGMQVMMDRDLANLYDVETKRINEQVKRNIQRFPEKYCFQVSLAEKNELVAKCDRFVSLKHSSYLPICIYGSWLYICKKDPESDRLIMSDFFYGFTFKKRKDSV